MFSKHLARKLKVTALPEVDHSLADAALKNAIEAHQAAQKQAEQAQQTVAKLRSVNLRNGFAPAIRDSFDRKLGDAT